MINPKLSAICRICGFTRGSHSTSEYYSEYYTTYTPFNCCPGHEDCIDQSEDQGTTLKLLEKDKEK